MPPIRYRTKRAQKNKQKGQHKKYSATSTHRCHSPQKDTRQESVLESNDAISASVTGRGQHALRENPNGSTYLPLDKLTQQFRLLTLFPSTGTDPIDCQLDVHLLNNCPRFEALSYCWGDPTPMAPITINGVGSKVSRNLGVALQYLRQPQSPRVLWVDAVCINQLDILERNHQVCLMHEVYSTAYSVLVWLGEASDESDTAMDLLKEWSAWPTRTQHAETPPILDSVICRPWWSRIWIVQELALARSDPIILCGRKCLPWSDFMTGCVNSGLDLLNDDSTERTKGIFYRWLLHHVRAEVQSSSSKRSKSLCDMLRDTKDFEASDPRDKIYGCLGLLEDEICSSLQPDYGIPTERVYLAATKHILKNESSPFFSTFSFYSLSRRSRPSWVPNFADQRTASPRNPDSRTSPGIMPGRSRRASFKDRGRLLSIQGLFFDTLSTCVELKSPNQRLLQIQGLEKMVRQATKRPLPPLHPFHALERDVDIVEMLSGGQHEDDGNLRYQYEYFAWEAGLLSNPDGLPSPEEMAQPKAIFGGILHAFLPGRYFFLTKQGFAGLSVSPVLNGDVVVLLGGEDLPTVLRPRGTSYTMLGAASVAGIMRNELWDLYNQGLIKGTTFMIR